MPCPSAVQARQCGKQRTRLALTPAVLTMTGQRMAHLRKPAATSFHNSNASCFFACADVIIHSTEEEIQRTGVCLHNGRLTSSSNTIIPHSRFRAWQRVIGTRPMSASVTFVSSLCGPRCLAPIQGSRWHSHCQHSQRSASRSHHGLHLLPNAGLSCQHSQASASRPQHCLRRPHDAEP